MEQVQAEPMESKNAEAKPTNGAPEQDKEQVAKQFSEIASQTAQNLATLAQAAKVMGMEDLSKNIAQIDAVFRQMLGGAEGGEQEAQNAAASQGGASQPVDPNGGPNGVPAV